MARKRLSDSKQTRSVPLLTLSCASRECTRLGTPIFECPPETTLGYLRNCVLPEAPCGGGTAASSVALSKGTGQSLCKYVYNCRKHLTREKGHSVHSVP